MFIIKIQLIFLIIQPDIESTTLENNWEFIAKDLNTDVPEEVGNFIETFLNLAIFCVSYQLLLNFDFNRD